MQIKWHVPFHTNESHFIKQTILVLYLLYCAGRRLHACIFMVFLIHINNQIIFIILNNQYNKTHNNVLFNLQFRSHCQLLTFYFFIIKQY